MTTDIGKKPREFWIAMNVYGIPHYTFRKLDDMPTIYRNDAFLVREVLDEPTPCANCERLEGDCKIISDQLREANEWDLKYGETIQRLQKQLEMCKEYLIKIQSENKKGEVDFNDQARYWRDQEIKSRMFADECLAKLEKE